MLVRGRVWQAPPGWPTPPAGWAPPPGWAPPADWPPAPPNWEWWQPDPSKAEPAVPAAVLRPRDRTTLVWETRFVLLAFLYSAITTAVIVLAQAATGGSALDVFDNVVSHHNALNLAL